MTEQIIKKPNAVMRINLRIRTPEVADLLAQVQERERSTLIEHALCVFLVEHKSDHMLKMLVRRHNGDETAVVAAAPAARSETPHVRNVVPAAEGIAADSYGDFVV